MTRPRFIFLFCALATLVGVGFVLQNRPAPPATSPAPKPAAAAIATATPWRAELPRGHANVPDAPARRTIQSDPLAPLAVVAAQPAGPERSAAIETMVNAVARTDTPGALELAQALRSGLDDGTLEHRLQLWTEEAPADAIAWVKAQPAGPLRDRLLARAAYVRVQSNPPEALELLQLMLPDPANEPATQAVLKLWHQRDPTGAAAWLAQNSKR